MINVNFFWRSARGPHVSKRSFWSSHTKGRQSQRRLSLCSSRVGDKRHFLFSLDSAGGLLFTMLRSDTAFRVQSVWAYMSRSVYRKERGKRVKEKAKSLCPRAFKAKSNRPRRCQHGWWNVIMLTAVYSKYYLGTRGRPCGLCSSQLILAVCVCSGNR